MSCCAQLRECAHWDLDGHVQNAEGMEGDARAALVALSHVLQDYRHTAHDLPLSSGFERGGRKGLREDACGGAHKKPYTARHHLSWSPCPIT
eukprot:scaffold14342_cov18-Tisochrysis_lutea.AAC.2